MISFECLILGKINEQEHVQKRPGLVKGIKTKSYVTQGVIKRTKGSHVHCLHISMVLILKTSRSSSKYRDCLRRAREKKMLRLQAGSLAEKTLNKFYYLIPKDHPTKRGWNDQRVSSGPMDIPGGLCKQETIGSHSSSAPNTLALPPASLPNSLPSSSSTLQMPLLPLCDVVIKHKAVVLDYMESNSSSTKKIMCVTLGKQI